MTEQELTTLAEHLARDFADWTTEEALPEEALLARGFLVIKAELEATRINLDNAMGALRDIYKLRGIEP